MSQFLYTAKTADAAATALHNQVLPLYKKLDIPVESILTDNGTEFYELLEALQADVDEWLHRYNYPSPQLPAPAPRLPKHGKPPLRDHQRISVKCW